MELVQFKLLLSIFLTAFLLVPSIQAKDVHYCDKRGNYPVKITGVTISPDPVLSGKPATFSLSASADQAIDGGELVIQVSFFGVRIHSEKHNLCEKTSCPLSDNFVISHSQVLPGFTPAGKYSLKMTLVGKDRSMLSCVGFDFNIRSPPLVSDS